MNQQRERNHMTWIPTLMTQQRERGKVTAIRRRETRVSTAEVRPEASSQSGTWMSDVSDWDHF